MKRGQLPPDSSADEERDPAVSLPDEALRVRKGLPVGHGRRITVIQQYQTVAHALARRIQPDQALPLFVTSPSRGEGKTTVSIGLGIVLSRDLGYSTIVVDAAYPFPALHRMVSLDPEPGLTDVIFRSVPLDQAIRVASGSLPDLLPAGSPLNPIAEFIQPAAVHDVLTELTQQYQIVIFDGPGMSTGMQGELISEAIACSVFVVRLHRTTDTELKAAISRCRSHSVLGIVVNGAGEGK